jgi:hypothetical protein
MAKDKGRGSRVVKPGSDEAKRIEQTHGFGKMQAQRDKREKSPNAGEEKGDKQ